jgi:hypothetical protein
MSRNRVFSHLLIQTNEQMSRFRTTLEIVDSIKSKCYLQPRTNRAKKEPAMAINFKGFANVDQIVDAATPIIEYIVARDKREYGGVFCITDKRGMPIVVRRYGHLDSLADFTMILAHAHDIAIRLAKKSNCYASSQVEDWASGEKAPGAVWGHNYILSFNGFGGQTSEVAMLAVATIVGDIAEHIADFLIARNESQQLYEELLAIPRQQ